MLLGIIYFSPTTITQAVDSYFIKKNKESNEKSNTSDYIRAIYSRL